MFGYRKPGTNTRGGGFTPQEVEMVWRKATVVPGVDPSLRRLDACGAWIDRYLYGVTTQHGTGWEIDHIVPVSRGGGDHLTNLQPLQWENNRAKSDGPLVCTVAARAA